MFRGGFHDNFADRSSPGKKDMVKFFRQQRFTGLSVSFDNGDVLEFSATPSVQDPVELAEGAVETVDFELDDVSCQAAS